MRAHSRPKECAAGAATTLQKHVIGRIARKQYEKTKSNVIRVQSLARRRSVKRKVSAKREVATKRLRPRVPMLTNKPTAHPYFDTIDGADASVVSAVSLAAEKRPIPSLVREQFQRTLNAPVNKSNTSSHGVTKFSFPYGTAKENKHFLPVLFWAAYQNAHLTALQGVDYLDFHHRTFQEFFENDTVEKEAGDHVLTLCANMLGLLVEQLRLKKPDEAWKRNEQNFIFNYEPPEVINEMSRKILTYHRTDSTRYFINVYLFTVSLAMAAAAQDPQ